MKDFRIQTPISVCLGLALVALTSAHLKAASDFVIEAEDFNYNSGQYLTQSDTMPYYGGAYNGLSAVADVDYANNDDLSSDVYRVGENPNVNITQNGDVDRDSWTVTSNYRIGWTDTADWFNYTRNFPDGFYLPYAALSHSSTADHMLKGTLWQVTSGANTTTQTLVQLGTFDAPGSGGWGLNNRVPLQDGNGNSVVLHLQGLMTLRYAAESADIDYYIFKALQAPQISQQPTNTTAVEGGSATFSVALVQPAGASFQWLRGAANIPGATAATLALSQQPIPYIPEQVPTLTAKESDMARSLFSSTSAPCLKCHATGDPQHDKIATAPNFLLAKERLKPDWVVRWITDPQAISPGTSMPSGLFRHENDRWVFAGPTPPSFQGYDKDHRKLLTDYIFQLTPEEQRRVSASMGRKQAAAPPAANRKTRTSSQILKPGSTSPHPAAGGGSR